MIQTRGSRSRHGEEEKEAGLDSFGCRVHPDCISLFGGRPWAGSQVRVRFKALSRKGLSLAPLSLSPPLHCELLSKQPLAQPALGCVSTTVLVQSTYGHLELLDDADSEEEKKALRATGCR